jgi:hypothetical protein
VVLIGEETNTSLQTTLVVSQQLSNLSFILTCLIGQHIRQLTASGTNRAIPLILLLLRPPQRLLCLQSLNLHQKGIRIIMLRRDSFQPCTTVNTPQREM